MTSIDDSTFPLQPHFEVCRVWPADFSGFGRGMRCTEQVLKGDEFLSIPLEKCWTVAAARSCPEIAALGEDVLECVSEYSLIAVHMLVMKNQGADAEDFRREHLEMLSSAQFETLLDWTDEDLSMLAGSKWSMVAPACKEDIELEFSELQEVLSDFFAAHRISSDTFVWAHRILISRAVQFFNEDGSMLYVLGGADLFNHSVDVPVGNDDVQVRQSSDSEKQLLVVRACRDYAVGEQAFFSYSNASNGRLLMMAGFVVPDNPYDAMELTLTFPVTRTSLPFYLELAEGLDAGLRTPGSAVAEETKAEFLETLPNDAEQPSEVALHVHLSQAALRAQLERVLAFIKLDSLCRANATPTREAIAACDADPSSRTMALQRLAIALTSMQKGYARSMKEDEDELPQAVAEAATGNLKAKRKAMALQVLIGEKRIFGMALELLDTTMKQ